MRPTRDPVSARAPRWLEPVNRAAALRRQGDREGAIAAYRAAVAISGVPPAAFFNLGNALCDAGRWAEAEGYLARALEAAPDLVEAAMQLARCAQRQGQAEIARERFARVLQIDPRNFSGRLELGHLCRQAGLLPQAVEHYGQAIEAAPQRWEPRLALARTLEEAGRRDQAAAHYHRALALAAAQIPGGARRIHWNMAKYRLERGDAAGALEAARQALLTAETDRPAPDADERGEILIDMGDALMRLGLTEEAHRAFEQASAATTEATLVRLAETAFRYNLWSEAQEVLQRNVELHPESPTAAWNLAHAYSESWQMQDALAALERAEALGPQPGAPGLRAAIVGRMGDAHKALGIYRELARAEGPRSRFNSSAAMSALYSDRFRPEEVAALHRELFLPLGEGARDRASFRNGRDPGRRLKLGMVTADLHRQHPVCIFMQPVLARLDRAAFELSVYFTGTSVDEQTRIARGRVDHWVEAAGWQDAQLARRIEADGIDLLLDLSGHTGKNRLHLFGQRAAPVQATFLGYPGSTGVPNMDWILVDPVVAPESHAPLYSERLIHLPNTVFCYAPDAADYPFPALGAAHAARPLTFGSFNNVPKLTQRTIRLWSRVLQAVPDARLLLKAPSFKDDGAVRAFRDRFAAEGIEPARLEFRGPVGLADMMAEYADVDIALDPVPYNGGTTTLQAMWMGVPVVVMEGGQFAARMGASFMAAAGLRDWVAADDAEYVAIAARMAADRQALLALKQGMRRRLLSRPAWDIDRYVRDLEAALRRMWVEHCHKP